MIKMTITVCGVVLGLCAMSAIGQEKKGPPPPALALTSPAFADGTDIPPKFTQAAGDKVISPELNWANVPAGAQSLMLLMHDPDVARNRTTDDQTHWVIWNIPATAKGLPENVPPQPKLPDGTIQGKNAGDTVGYRGPGAPATGPRHHYTFELYALDTKLDLGPESSRMDVLKALNGHVLAKAAYVGLFHRPQ